MQPNANIIFTGTTSVVNVNEHPCEERSLMTRARNYERESIIAVEIIGLLVTFRPLHSQRERYKIRG